MVHLRQARAGDVGWVFHRQCVLYEQHGYDRTFETYVAQGIAPFLEDFDPARDRLWIAEDQERPVGAIAIQHVDAWAQLRWYFVEPEARGRGIGGRLVETAVAFARQAGYPGVFLWTVDDLHAARRQYERAGFRLVEERPCPWMAGQREQKWELRF